MAKGQIAVLIIVLIVIGAAVYFALPVLTNLPANPFTGRDIPTNNNIITIDSYTANPLKMFPGEQTVVSFLIQNNGDHAVDSVRVNFYDLGGMALKSLLCDISPGTKQSCTFYNLQPFEARKVVLTLEAPSVGSITTFKISYSVNYPYSGTRSAVIPVIDGLTRIKPLGRFSESKEIGRAHV